MVVFLRVSQWGGGGSTTSANNNNNTDVSKDTGHAKKGPSKSQNDEKKGSASVKDFMNSAAGYQADAVSNRQEALSIKKQLSSAQKAFDKDLNNYNKITSEQTTFQQNTAKTIADNEAQMTSMQSRLQNAIQQRNSLGSNTGFMGDGSSEINSITAELNSLGASTANLQTQTTSTSSQANNAYKSITKSSKNLSKKSATMHKVTTRALNSTSKAQKATADGINKSQKLNMTGQITMATGGILQGVGAAMTFWHPIAGATLMACGWGAEQSGNMMSIVGTKGEYAGKSAQGNLSTAAAALNSAGKTANTTSKSANKSTKQVTMTNQQLQNSLNDSFAKMDANIQNLDNTRTIAAQAQSFQTNKNANNTVAQQGSSSRFMINQYTENMGSYGKARNYNEIDKDKMV